MKLWEFQGIPVPWNLPVPFTQKPGSLALLLRTESAGDWEMNQTSLILQNKP